MKTISVVIISYNYSHLVAHAIDSVLGQTRKPDKILVVDDAANDGVDKIAKMYGVDCLIRPQNLGTVKNFNDILMNRVHTDKLMMLGADNWLRPDALEKMDVDADIVSSDMFITGEIGNKCRIINRCVYRDGYYIREFGKMSRAIRTHNYIHGSSLYNVDMAKQFGYEAMHPETSKRTQEDWKLWQRMIKIADATHIHVDEPLLYYRRHNKNFNGAY